MTLGTGIRHPEQQLLSGPTTFKIREQRLVFPVNLRYAWPNFFDGGAYTTVTLGLHSKYLIAASYTPTGRDSTVKEAFGKPIANLKDHCDLKSFSYGVCVSWGMMSTSGLYVDLALDMPLHDSNVTTYTKSIYSSADSFDVKKD